jgi:hypothetical protein
MRTVVRPLSLALVICMMTAGMPAGAAFAGESDSGIVRDGIDTQNNTREGIDTQNNTREGIDKSGIDEDGIDRRYDKTGLTREGIDKEGLDDDVERPE